MITWTNDCLFVNLTNRKKVPVEFVWKYKQDIKKKFQVDIFEILKKDVKQ